MNLDTSIKIVVLGQSCVGKSSIVSQFALNTYPTTYRATIGLDYFIRNIDMDDTSYKVQLWDTSGQERFKSLVKSYYLGTQGILFVYDASNPQSFVELKEWMDEVDRHFDHRMPPVKVIANKTDLCGPFHCVSKHEVEELLNGYQLNLKDHWVSLSAKDVYAVKQVMMDLTRMIVNHPHTLHMSHLSNLVNLKKSPKKHREFLFCCFYD